MTYLTKTVGFYSNYPKEKIENLKFTNRYTYQNNDQISFQKGNLKSFSGAKIKKTGIKNKPALKKAIKIAAGIVVTILLIKSGHNLINKTKPDYSLDKIEKAAEKLSTNLKFEKADLVNDINKIMRGQKLPQESVDLYMTTVSDSKPKVYMSENAGQMMDVLAIAASSPSNKDQITPSILKPFLIKGLKYDKGSILNDAPDAITGDGEPWYYIAASLLSKNYPNIADHMPQAERETLQSRGFFKSVADDFMESIGKKAPPEQYLGDILDARDHEYMIEILSNRGDLLNLPSDNKWFGPAAVGYSIRGKLSNIKGMTPQDCEKFLTEYIQNPSNHQRFNTDDLYRDKVISSYIYFNLNEAIEHNSGKVNSGLSALAMQEASLFTNKTGEILLNQVKEEVSQFYLFSNETKKLDVAIKTMVLARNNQYSLLAPETRFAMRKFEVEHPASTATATFKLAEDHYQIQLSKEAKNHEVLQMNVYLETTRPEGKLNPTAIKKACQNLINYNSNMLVKIKNEIKVEELADPAGDRIKTLKNMDNNLFKQNEQLKTIINQIDKPKGSEEVKSAEPTLIDKAKKYLGEQANDLVEKTNELGKDITDIVKNVGNVVEGAGKLIETGKNLTGN